MTRAGRARIRKELADASKPIAVRAHFGQAIFPIAEAQHDPVAYGVVWPSPRTRFSEGQRRDFNGRSTLPLGLADQVNRGRKRRPRVPYSASSRRPRWGARSDVDHLFKRRTTRVGGRSFRRRRVSFNGGWELSRATPRCSPAATIATDLATCDESCGLPGRRRWPTSARVTGAPGNVNRDICMQSRFSNRSNGQRDRHGQKFRDCIELGLMRSPPLYPVVAQPA